MSQFELQALQMLRSALQPELQSAGFVRDDRDPLTLTFRKTVTPDGFEAIQIVDVQVGERSLAHHFTVNLAVFNSRFYEAYGDDPVDQPDPFHCLHDLTKRLGFLFVPPKGVLGHLFGVKPRPPHDHWWKLSGRASVIRRNIEQAKECLIQRGIPWLDEMATEAKFRWAMDQLEQRKELIARRGPPKVIGPLFQPGEKLTRESIRKKLYEAMGETEEPTGDNSTDHCG